MSGFEEAHAYLNGLGIDAMKSLAPSLHRIQAICEALNHPELSIPTIHITGTNGKTSTARIASALLAATGLTVGTYTSPHLETVRERITLSGEPITEDVFGEMFDHMRPYLTLVEGRLGEKLSYFEVLTALYFLWAAEAPVDISVVEVGLGGRWDATNVVPAPVAVVTNVSFDHTGLLGNDKASIAKEKAGIIKPNATVVTGEAPGEALTVIEAEVAGAGAKLSRADKDFSVTENLIAIGGRYLSISTSAAAYEGLFLPLHGAHQGLNAATALEAVTRFLPAQDLEQEVVAEGFAKSVVPGRLEPLTFPSRNPSDIPDIPAPETPSVVLDVAHNPDGMSALVSSLWEAFAFERVIFVVGILRDKDHEGMLREISRVPSHLVLTEARSVRSVPPQELADACERLGLSHEVIEGVPAAVSSTMQGAGPDDLVTITGSHYVVGEARSFLLG
ncbi:MAG: bifunctional folylpolyglutamate synthase/dihydrofolate synthase [Actinomycetota bacterium]